MSKDEITLDSDVYIIGFDYNRSEIPFKVMNLFLDLEKKDFMCIVSSGLEINEKLKQFIEKKISAFFPEEGNYLGTCLCAGEFPEEVLNKANRLTKEETSKKQAEFIYYHYEKTKEHPDEKDYHDILEYTKKVLKIL